MRTFAVTTALLTIIIALAACSPSRPTGHAGKAMAGAGASFGPATAIQPTRHYNNPFAYCQAIGTIDQPDARYSGAHPPPAVIAGLIKAFDAPASASVSQTFARASFWRCMDGKVYACNVGANLPCQAKANSSRAPTAGEKKFCAANHDSLYIPLYITGHNTIYDWRCEGKRPVAGKQLAKVDARGYIADIWYLIRPPDG